MNIPYGYQKDPDDPKAWIIDDEAALVVKKIFTLCMEGKGPSQIAALLEKEKVLNPTAYKQREGWKTQHPTPENEYRWHENTVVNILERILWRGFSTARERYNGIPAVGEGFIRLLRRLLPVYMRSAKSVCLRFTPSCAFMISSSVAPATSALQFLPQYIISDSLSVVFHSEHLVSICGTYGIQRNRNAYSIFRKIGEIFSASWRQRDRRVGDFWA